MTQLNTVTTFSHDDARSGDIASILLTQSRISLGAADRAHHLQAETGEELDVILTRLGFVTEDDLAQAYADGLEISRAGADEFPTKPVAVDSLPGRYVRTARILPLGWEESADGARALVLAMANPLDTDTVTTVSFAIDAPVICCVATASDIQAAVQALYDDTPQPGAHIVDLADEAGQAAQHSEDTERLRDLTSDAPVIRLVNKWLADATEAGASDIHIEPADDAVQVRLRVDGVLHDIDSQPLGSHPALVSRIKIMAKLDIGERRLPQDGRLDLAVRGQTVDVRVSVLPSVRGESVVLRLLNRGAVALDFESLGIEGDQKDRFVEVLDRPHGILLVTGPTGSGKTTTLYAGLEHIKQPSFKILTAEDPVEYRLDGVVQTQVKPQVGLTFASLLRSFLRHDPDVIMVGEIRDVETARIAAQAALTGHLVLSTLHTNDAASAITRLMDMGVEDYLLTATINGIVGQRLLRRLCPHCRETYVPDAELVGRLGLRDVAPGGGDLKLARPAGCNACNGTGYHGRMAVMEVLPVTTPIQQSIMRGATTGELRQAAIAEGMRTMFQAGLARALARETSMEEVMRVTGMD
ncbi:GspE/PulE family protein [Pyruvatibacter sp.]|uniref:GspE/PulE family protein n=1 Tax=Pyruvatibacter sp. TaxID=1981328 RepID=UPI003262D47A